MTVSPILIKPDVLPLAAHFFVFWFGVLSNITPPPAATASMEIGSRARSHILMGLFMLNKNQGVTFYKHFYY
ncbi:hypothetical protein XBJ2_1160003 [Xenorhabdus bovienii str. Jollieti]|uniref:Uncharacterized protein n=1 Tax=Xenorhabdus bovienii (strain SS-2004) TaxID=406818 RepID=D3V3E9_XENBS|nr:hypothetical protein XBJ1_2138 [Xenorhabdus bovienii SS-2004]CDH27059.1 hypothetical protein XBJ2_1160003 [Xenorhabdus bovienii str. Jollieti]